MHRPASIHDILTTDFTGQSVAIIGHPATGKTWLGKALAAATGRQVIHTDDYIRYGNVEGLYVLLEELQTMEGPHLIEGVMGYRLLRKGAQTGLYYPDVVIHLTVPAECVERTYWQVRKEPEKLPGVKRLGMACDTVLRDYLEMNNPHPPVWWDVQNEY